jgi:lactoylglutathione lyase
LLAALPPLSQSPDAVGLKTPRFISHAGFSLARDARRMSRTHKALIGLPARRGADPLPAGAFCCYFRLSSAVPTQKQISEQFQGSQKMRFLHTMLRVRNLDTALKFYRDALGLKEVRRIDNDKAKFTLVFLCAPEDEAALKQQPSTRGAPLVELTYNWDEEKYGEDRYFGHLAYEVDDIYATCDRLMKQGITINRPPRDGNMAFVRSPDLHSIELLQKGDPKPPAEPWTSMPNTGHW